MQDLLWAMIPQWDYLPRASTPNLPRLWQVHNHCLSLHNQRGISGSKTSQWELFKCMRNKYGEDEFHYMPECIVLPRYAGSKAMCFMLVILQRQATLTSSIRQKLISLDNETISRKASTWCANGDQQH